MAEGTVEDFDAAAVDAVKTNVATLANVPADRVDVQIQSSSVLVDITIHMSNQTQTASIASTMQSIVLQDAPTASAALGINVTNVPTVSSQSVILVIAPCASSGFPCWCQSKIAKHTFATHAYTAFRECLIAMESTRPNESKRTTITVAESGTSLHFYARHE